MDAQEMARTAEDGATRYAVAITVAARSQE